MKIKDGFTLRNIAGCEIVVPVGNAIKTFNGMITLNDSASFFWQLMQKDTDVEQMVKRTTEEYEVSEDKAKEDIENFISLLKENNLIEE
ncbi:MAG TPA: PqqD family protein [Ruminococcaceae bacterium]|nr:PqqD family protein [Oscillospiraceae bacterium]